LDLVVSTIGPGSFTGLRIGLSTARTFATALSIPVAGVNTLDLIATHYDTTGPFEKPEEIPLLIVLETKRQDFYARYYDAAGNPLGDAFAANASFIMEMAPEAAFCVGGDCLVRFKEEAEGDYQLLDPVTLPDPAVLARLGIKQAQEQAVREMPKPLYLRGADVSQPKTPPRKLEGN
jgi:tRNA threonylcarbamoyl adenosine modification protein YeaZ